MGDDTTLVGEVQGDGDPALAWAQLIVGKRETKRDRAAPIAVRLDDGAVIEIALDGERRAAVLAPATPPRKGRWDKVADDPRAALVIDAAPGDHVEVDLSGWIVPRGARIAVRGVESVRAGDRVMTARRLAIVDLDRGVAGDGAAIEALDAADRSDRERAERDAARDAERQAARATAAATAEAGRPKPPPPKVPVPWRFGAPFCLVFGAALAIVGIARSGAAAGMLAAYPPHASGLVATGALSLVIALAMWSSRPLYETQGAPGAADSSHPTWAIGKTAIAAMSVQLLAGATAIAIAEADHKHAAVWTAAGWLVPIITAAGYAIWLGVRQRKNLRLAQLILGARALPSPLPAAQWGRFEGTVAATAGGPALTRTVSYIQKSQTRNVTSRQQDGSTVTKEETSYWYEARPSASRLRGFEVVVGSQRVAIGEGEAMWAAPAVYQVVPKSQTSGLAYQTLAAVNDGDSIVVLGRVIMDGERPTVRGSGPESLLLFAAPSAARTTLTRSAAIAIGGITALTAAAIACAAMAIHILTLG